MKKESLSGFARQLVKLGGTKETRVKKTIGGRNFTKEDSTMPSDCSRALTPKQGGKPE